MDRIVANDAARFVQVATVLCLLTSCRSPTLDRSAESRSNDGDSRPIVESAELEKDKQQYIWEIEHTAFELEKKFGAALTAALASRDEHKLRHFCRPNFEGTILDSTQQTTIDHNFIQEVRTEKGAGQAADVSRLMTHLCGYLEDFTEIKKLKCRVLDLHAAGRNPASGNWSMTLHLSGVGKDSQQAPVEFSSQHRLDCHFADDQAIAAGTIVDRWRVLSEQFRSCQSPLFEEVTAVVGLDKVDIRDNWEGASENARQYYSQMAVEDYDRDGYLDLAVASANGRWRLLKSIHGKEFRDVTLEVKLPPWAGEVPGSRSLIDQAFLATWIDFDNDGYPDLILGDRLFRNVTGKAFEDVTDSSGLIFGYTPKGCVVADYDCDGLLDLYVLYQYRRDNSQDGPVGWIGDDESGAQNHLWRNVGNGRFVNVTEDANVGGGDRESFAAAWLYANEDHYPDLYIANDFSTNVLLLNQGNGTFRDISQSAGVADYATSMGVAAGDLTGDGSSEIYVANMFSKMGRRIIAHVSPDDYPPGVFQQIQGSCAGNRLYTPLSDELKYEETSEHFGVNQIGWAYAPALADFDADGWLDIYAATGFLSFDRKKPDG